VSQTIALTMAHCNRKSRQDNPAVGEFVRHGQAPVRRPHRLPHAHMARYAGLHLHTLECFRTLHSGEARQLQAEGSVGSVAKVSAVHCRGAGEVVDDGVVGAGVRREAERKEQQNEEDRTWASSNGVSGSPPSIMY